MRRALVIAGIALAWLAWAQPAAAQAPAAGGYYSGGYYYVPDGQATTYWPTNNETAYYYGPYAVAPGFGPYLHLGGESGWNPNIGTTYNSYPPGNYYTDYGLPYIAVPRGVPYAWPVYGVSPYGVSVCWPAYPFCR